MILKSAQKRLFFQVYFGGLILVLRSAVERIILDTHLLLDRKFDFITRTLRRDLNAFLESLFALCLCNKISANLYIFPRIGIFNIKKQYL